MSAVSSSRHIYYVMIIGVLVRVLAWSNTHVVNPDGTLYITQAKAIFYGQKEALYCGYDFLSSYVVLIVGAHWFFSDWIFSARMVSFLFGSATLVPLYFLLRRYLDAQVSALVTLLYAMLPVYTGGSIDLIRDPVCWFFATTGLYFFIRGLQDSSHFSMLCSSLSFLMASWSRIEASLFIVVSLLYLLIGGRKGNVKSVVLFSSPLFTIIASGLTYCYLARDIDIMARLRLDDIIERLTTIGYNYKEVRATLKQQAFLNRDTMLGFFLLEARTNAWLVALGTLLNRLLESLLYLYAIPLIFGLRGFCQRRKGDPTPPYFIALIILILLLLYTHIVKQWWIEYRHVTLFIISACIIIGFGIDNIIENIKSRFNIKRITAIVLFAVTIILSTLPKNLLPRDTTLQVFKEIGEFVGRRESSAEVINISTPISIHSWISFYANLAYEGAVCPAATDANCWEHNQGDMNQLVMHVEEYRAKYFVWTERQWPDERLDVAQMVALLGLREIGRWNHEMTGEIILFEVRVRGGDRESLTCVQRRRSNDLKLEL